MARGSARRSQIVPEARKALDAMKYEIAAELGLPVGRNSSGFNGADAEFGEELGSASSGAGSTGKEYWGNIASRDTGAVGGQMVRNLIRKAEQDLFNLA